MSVNLAASNGQVIDEAKLLIIDDNMDNVRLLSAVLKQENYKISVAMTGEDALSVIPRFKPELILLDVMMPDIDGFKLCQRLKQSETTAEIPIIFVTAKTQPEDIAHGFKLGAVDYITKPINKLEVLARVKSHVQLYRLNQSLEHQIQLRTRELEKAHDDMSAFSYTVSHDLRAPIRVINGFSSILLEDYKASLDEEGQDLLRRLQNASKEMSVMIEGYLKLFRSSHGAKAWEEVNLSDMARDIADSLKSSITDWPGKIEIEDNITAYGDVHLLNVLLENLIGNAWKYTIDEKSPRIHFGTVTRNNQLTYFIKDNGLGFDMKYVDDIFKPFSRVSMRKDIQGTGVGLASAKRIVEHHGGEITAESSPSQGACFYFTLANKSDD